MLQMTSGDLIISGFQKDFVPAPVNGSDYRDSACDSNLKGDAPLRSGDWNVVLYYPADHNNRTDLI